MIKKYQVAASTIPMNATVRKVNTLQSRIQDIEHVNFRIFSCHIREYFEADSLHDPLASVAALQIARDRNSSDLHSGRRGCV